MICLKELTGFMRRRLLAVIMIIATIPAVLPAQQAPQAHSDNRISIIRQHFTNIELYRRLSEYDKVAHGLTDIIRIAKECLSDGSNPQEPRQAIQKAERDLLDLQRMLPEKIKDILTRMEREANDLKDIDDQSIANMEQWIESVSQVRREPLDYTYFILTDVTAFRSSYSNLAIAGMTKEQRTSHLRASDDLSTAVDFACAATEPAKAEQYVQEARQHFTRIERIADQAEMWSELRDKKAEDGGVDLDALDRRRRDLGMVEDEVSQLMTWAKKVSREAQAFQDAYDIAKRIDSRQKASIGDLLPLINAYKETLKIHDVNNSPLQWWLTSGTVLSKAPESIWKSLDFVVTELKKPEIRDAGLRLSRADAEIQELSKVIDKIQADILETDAFAGLCIGAAGNGQSNLNRADRCLRSAPFRIRQTAQNQQGQASGNPPPAGQSPPASSPPPPGTLPAPTTSPAQPPQQASQNVVPPIEPNVFGGIRITGGSAKILIGQSVRFIATDMGNRPHVDVFWNSHDEELLSLGPDGVATGLRPGTATIQAKSPEDPTQIAYYSVEVVEPETQAAGTQAGPPPSAGGGFGNRGIDVGVSAEADQPSSSQGSASDTTRPLPPDQTETSDPPVEAEPVADDRQGGISLLGQDTASLGPDAEPQDLGPDGGFNDRGLELVPNRDLDPQEEPDAKRASRQGPAAGGSGSGTRGGTTTPSIPLLAFQQQGQPAAWHIFATGSRMGWAAAYGRYTDGPADQDIINHLIMAGEHSMWANRESYEPYKAWPHWSEIKIRFRTWAEQVIRSPRGELREQLALAVSSYAGNLAEQVTFQVLGEKKQMPNCDGAYIRLGFHMAFGQTSLQLAEGARLTGQVQFIDKARKDALNHLRQAVRILIEYEKTKVVTGRCADLRDVRAEMESLLNTADLAAQIRMIMHAWETASERIRALSGVTAQPSTKTAPQPTPPLPPKPKAQPVVPRVSSQGLWADPGELEGEWVTTLGRYRFTKEGEDYIGRLEKIFPPAPIGHSQRILYYLLSEQGYSEGDLVCRARRTGPNTYKGTYRQRIKTVTDAGGKSMTLTANDEVDVSFTVLGDYTIIASPPKPIPERVSTFTYDVSVRLMRIGGVMQMPNFEGLSYEQRDYFDSSWHNSSLMWFVASREGAGGEKQYVMVHDYWDPATQAIRTDYAKSTLASILRGSSPVWASYQQYMNACAGMKRKIEQAGFSVVLGPTTQASCTNRFEPRVGGNDARDNLLGVPTR